MKINKIVKLCKDQKNIRLFDDVGGAQWLSDGCGAIYKLTGCPRFDIDSICTTYDIDEKKKKQMRCTHEIGLPQMYDFEDWSDGEVLCESGPIGITLGPRSLIPYSTTRGAAFFNEAYFQPLNDNLDMIQVYERRMTNGKLYFAVKQGMELVAIVCPMDVISSLLVTNLKRLTTQCVVSYQHLGHEDDTQEFDEDEPHQVGIYVEDEE